MSLQARRSPQRCGAEWLLIGHEECGQFEVVKALSRGSRKVGDQASEELVLSFSYPTVIGFPSYSESRAGLLLEMLKCLFTWPGFWPVSEHNMNSQGVGE